MSEAIRTLVVDDEVHARRGLMALLSGEADVVVVGEAANGSEAVSQIRDRRPDLVFLDVEMPGMSGFEVLEKIGLNRMPRVVFVTAYDRYAVSAFDVNAVDYLLKPFTDNRFRSALDRVRRSLRRPDRADSGRDGAGALERFTVKVGGTLEVHRVDEIDWIEADEYYVKVHIGGRMHMIRRTMSSLESSLPPDRFARIHRSAIVNLDRVAALEPLSQGDFIVVLADGSRLRMSRRRRESLAGVMRNLS